MDLFKVRKMLAEGYSIFNIPLRVVFYARVSSEKDEQLNSLDNQVFYYNNYIRENPEWIFVNGYVDEGISGTRTVGRNDFLQMIEDGKNGKYDLIITKEICRFARDTLDSIKYTRELLSYGIGVYFQSDNINTFEPDSELRLTIMASIAQEEVRKLSERLKFGFKRAVEKGRVLGAVPYGYFKEDCKLTINEEEAKIVRLIFKIYNEEKMGLRRLTNELEKQGIMARGGNPFVYTTLHSIIINPIYKGFSYGRKSYSIDYRTKKLKRLDKSEWEVRRDNNIPAIVSEEEWDKANELLEKRGKQFVSKEGSNQYRYKYSGKIICAEHNVSYHRKYYFRKNQEIEYWNCKVYQQKGKSACNSPTIFSYEIDSILSYINQQIYKNKDQVITGLLNHYRSFQKQDNYEAEIEKIKNQIDSIRKKKDKLLELSIEDLITKSEFIERNNRFNETLKKIQNDLETIENKKIAANQSYKKLVSLEESLNKLWANGLDDSLDNSTLLLDKIIVHPYTGDEKIAKIEIKLITGQAVSAELNHTNKKNYIISLQDFWNSRYEMIFNRPIKGITKKTYQYKYDINVSIAC